MAKRRAWSRALAGLGEGIAAAGSYGLRRYAQEDAQKAIDDRAAKTQGAILDRQQQMHDAETVDAILKKLVEDPTLDPSSVEAVLKLKGLDVQPGQLDTVSPPRRRLEARVGKRLTDAKSAEEVPSNQDIMGDSASSVPSAWTAGMLPAENDIFSNARPEARQMSERADVKRRAFMEKPTRHVTGTDPTTGQQFDEMIPDYNTGRVLTSPTPQRAGELEGDKKTAELTTSGPALAKQKADEAQAVQNVELSPDAIRKRVGESGAKAGAAESAAIRARTDHAREIIDLETKKALAAAQSAATAEEFKGWGEQIAKAREAANGAIPIIGQLRALWLKAQPQIAAMTQGSPDKLKELSAQIQQGYRPRGTLPTDVRKYSDLLEAARPRLARAMGNVGNFTEGEQARAGFVAPDFLDAINPEKGLQKLDRLEQLFLAAPSIAQLNKPGVIVTADQVNSIVDSYRRANPGDVELPGSDYNAAAKAKGAAGYIDPVTGKVVGVK